MSKFLTTTLILLSAITSVFAQNDLSRFITRSGDKLMEGDKEYRFISFNIPNLHLVEDNMTFEATNEWRFPDEFEITDALTTIKQMGGRAARTYVISICKRSGPNPIPCHVKRPGEFNEEAFRALDKVLEVANRVGVRVIIPMVDNWKWWGGIEQYAEYRGKTGNEFWTDPDLISDFKQTLNFIINRRNTYTGTLYKDDKAILAWETGNEILPPYAWTKEISAYIKSLDPNHLVWDGFYIGSKELETEVLNDPNIDIVSSHHYPAQNKGADEMVADIKRFRQQIAAKKVYFVGEFGFIPPAGIEKVLDAVIAEGLSGAMIWSLRYHNRDGGFYWHSEPASASLYNPYHYPGFPSGDGWNETTTLKVMRSKAFEIQGRKLPPMEVPAPSRLLPITSPAEISWQGSVGAAHYDVERSDTANGPWKVVGADVDDTWVRYRPLFSDATAEVGQSYYYRVRAKNTSGVSEPSNVVGPIKLNERFMIDEILDFSHLFSHEGKLTLESANARPYKEDPHRLRGTNGDALVYKTAGEIHSAKILTLMEGQEREFE
ncbi:MAG TPA: cellulase family glycosylhydrolase, partial [Pyrinomonadaceae bacterium]|nr:cellulase family glycosylhydrolase [Pyrinomonadaceae bacterium]